ncbi:MAG TPA: transposase [Anaerolineae bacterium]|nr:transposase [Anaerolineae bacterium]
MKEQESCDVRGMTHDLLRSGVHPEGDQLPVEVASGFGPVTVDTFAGPVKVAWDASSPLTPLGQAVYFIEFLKVSGRLDALIGDCPLSYTSPNAPAARDVIGTWVLSVLAGHRRYAHITALRSDKVLAELLGLERIVSEDSVRRALKAMPAADGLSWLQRHIDRCTHPLLGERYIIDVDTTVKPLYGHQEGAVVSYNPKKPGRPSHVHHTYMLAGLRLVLGVETLPGDEHTGAHSAPGLWALLDRTPRDCWPALLRGDSGIASEGVMREAEGRGLDYLFKLRLTKNVKRLIERTFSSRGWREAGQGWEGKEETLRLVGWSRHRRVVVLRRRLKGGMVARARDGAEQLRLSFAEIGDEAEVHEYAVLVTSLAEEALTIAQLYRDRADCENVFDELKNQWGWGGFTTHDLARCRLAARMVALVYNWWNIFVRLAEPDKHLEAITSRPLLLAGIAERTRHGRQTTLRISATHGRAPWAQRVLTGVAGFLRRLIDAAEQLTADERWARILAHAVRTWLDGRQLRAPPRLTAPA